MTLTQEVIRLVVESDKAMTVKALTNSSKITDHESRVGEVCRSLVDKKILKLAKATSGAHFSVGYQVDS